MLFLWSVWPEVKGFILKPRRRKCRRFDSGLTPLIHGGTPNLEIELRSWACDRRLRSRRRGQHRRHVRRFNSTLPEFHSPTRRCPCHRARVRVRDRGASWTGGNRSNGSRCFCSVMIQLRLVRAAGLQLLKRAATPPLPRGLLPPPPGTGRHAPGRRMGTHGRSEPGEPLNSPKRAKEFIYGLQAPERTCLLRELQSFESMAIAQGKSPGSKVTGSPERSPERRSPERSPDGSLIDMNMCVPGVIAPRDSFFRCHTWVGDVTGCMNEVDEWMTCFCPTGLNSELSAVN